MSSLQKLVFIFLLIARSSRPKDNKLSLESSLVTEDWSNVNSFQNCDLLFEKYQYNVTSNYHIFLEWIELFPDGYATKVNYTVISNYKNSIDRLLLNGIEPVVTLHSGDLPLVFGPLGGWTNPILVQYFANYARQVYKLFGNRVKTWITFHEPRAICESFKGLIGDDLPSGVAEYLCAHNILKAHAEANHIYDKGFRMIQKGTVSIALDIVWTKPANITDYEDIRAADRALHFEFGLFANPILNFDYPRIVIDRVAKRSSLEGFRQTRLPQLSYAEKKKISGTCDYLQINSYNCVKIVRANKEQQPTTPNIKIDSGEKVLKYLNPQIKEKWTHEDSHDVINWIKSTYHNPRIVMVQKECQHMRFR